MEAMRKPLQGIRNVIVFNWHYYVMSLGIILLILVFTRYLNPTTQVLLYSLCGLVLFSVVVSLLVTLYIYDFSSLYSLEWVDMVDDDITIVNIHAGFDETSALLKTKFPTATIHVFEPDATAAPTAGEFRDVTHGFGICAGDETRETRAVAQPHTER